MGRTDPVAHDPSVADYRASFPRCEGVGARQLEIGLAAQR